MKNNKILLIKLIVPFAVFLIIAYIAIFFTYNKVYIQEKCNNRNRKRRISIIHRIGKNIYCYVYIKGIFSS